MTITEAQQNKINQLVARFNAADYSVHAGGIGLPENWISLALLNANQQVFYMFGIDTDGSAHS